jgi:hypothetical protein
MWNLRHVASSCQRQKHVQDLVDWHSGSWHRVVVDNWSGRVCSRKPEWTSAIKWMACHASGPCFSMPRNWVSDGQGYQIWVSSVEDISLTALGFGQVINVRSFEHLQLVEHLQDRISLIERFRQQ